MRPKRIIEIMREQATGSEVTVKGWVRTRRDSKQVSFVALNDGSMVANLQIVVSPSQIDEQTLRRITTGACIAATGTLVASQGKGQSVEVQASKIEILGDADATFPLQKKGHTWEYLREVAHLRPRSNTFGAIFRIRNNMAFAVHKFFHDKGFVYFHTPLITGSDCEGAGQMFSSYD